MFFLCHAMHFSLWATLGPRYRAITLLEEGVKRDASQSFRTLDLSRCENQSGPWSRSGVGPGSGRRAYPLSTIHVSLQGLASQGSRRLLSSPSKRCTPAYALFFPTSQS
jgi:hypothetical protein